MHERKGFVPDIIVPVSVVEKHGLVIQRDLRIVVSGTTYVLSVSTQDYLEDLKEYNKKFSSDMKLYDNMLVLENVDNMEEVINQLAQISLQDVSPYLVKQSKT